MVITKANSPTFIHLKKKLFAEYNIIYHINDSYSIKDLSKVCGKHQLLFQKFDNKVEQLNLILIDSIFPNIIADVAYEVLLNRVKSFNDYIYLKKDFTIVDKKQDVNYFKHKFNSFIQLLLYSNITTEQVCRGEMKTDIIYYMKDNSQELKYYTIFDQNKLSELLVEKMELQINHDKSFVSNDEVSICFEISFS
jgi:hypothetical protein